ncbi:MAG: motility protein A [Chlamydiales bacterium]|nr:motility protein A [Chlamydiales bacterium]NCF71476.1 motility protein A [Chlamydiales bacterium]
MKIDNSTAIGLGLAYFMILVGMVLAVNFDIPLLLALFVYQPSSAALTIGGSLGAMIATYRMSTVKRFAPVVKSCIFSNPKTTAYVDLINELVDYATEARRNGVLALDSRVEEVEDPFIKTGLQLAIDGAAPEQIEDLMTLEISSLGARHSENQAMLLKWGEMAPAYGMIGTLIGLIAMLANLDDPDAIGPSMAVALITTMYGSMMANMFCIPVAGKLQIKTAAEIKNKEIVMSAILSIQNGDNPRIVRQKLMAYITPEEKELIADDEG